MRKSTTNYLWLSVFFYAVAGSAQVKIGDNPIVIGTSSLLELESSNKALVVTRVANTSSILSPVNGMMVYDLSSNCLKGYANGQWTGCVTFDAGSSSILVQIGNEGDDPDVVNSVITATQLNALGVTGVVADNITAYQNYIDANPNSFSSPATLIEIQNMINAVNEQQSELDFLNKKYNEVAFLTTHNSFNSAQDNFMFPNHNFNITAQLNYGVRGLMIDVYNVAGTPMVYHGFSFLGSRTLLSVLSEIKAFMDANPNEIVTIILECYTSANSIESVMNQSGISNYLYTHSGTVWPSLQTMINNGKRLVVFTDRNDASSSQGWYHYVWNYAVETHFSVNSINDFSCNYNRGNPANDLFIFNHFITNTTGVGDANQSLIANSNPFFLNRVMQCFQANNKFPNFITIDFYELGNGLSIVNLINSL